MKRSELVEFLRDVLRVCGESVQMEVVWLKKTEGLAFDDDDYELFVKSSSGTMDHACLVPLLEKFGMKVEKQGDVWVFQKKRQMSRRAASIAVV